MSRASGLKSGTARTSRSNKTNRSILQPSYQIYCVNFYDNGLNAVRDEFVKRVKDGLRRSVFVIDLETEVQEAILFNDISRRSSKFKKPSFIPEEPLDLALLRIRNCLDDYEKVSRQIEAELQFDIYQYWIKNMPADLKDRFEPKKEPKKSKGGTDTRRGSQKTAKGTKSKENTITDDYTLGEIMCFGMMSKEHNKVGKGNPLSKRTYIKDEPLNSKIIIAIIGNLDNMNNDFYKKLIDNRQPLRAIIHFLPEDCAYDHLVPRPRREKFLQDIVEKIQRDIHSLRKRSATKPVGIFQQQLPQMSMCLAAKYSDDIFDQLSWYLYDVHTLREQYVDYYIKPYHEINVKMNPATNLFDNFHMAESLSIQGHYLKAPVPNAYNDDTTVYMYMESLMSTFGNPRELMTEMEVLLLANPSPSVQTKVLDKIKVYANAFKSILKLSKTERLFVEEANPLLHNIISYMDHTFMRNIYHACLEYNILRRYFTSGYIIDSLKYEPYNGEAEPRFLPKYAKLLLTNDAVDQRIIELIDEYDDYTIEVVHPNVRLYTFKRALNEVFEYQKQIVIPTRLCFRDFTLYEMEQFLRDLVTPEMFQEEVEAAQANANILTQNLSVATLAASEFEAFQFRFKDGQAIKIDINFFVRPNSLKARKIAELQQQTTQNQTQSTTKSHSIETVPYYKTHRADESILTSRGNNVERKYDYIGLGPEHPMLYGYNLDDTRQTIKVKTSKYYFEEGLIELYEEKWNFRQMNKCLTLQIDGQKLHFANVKGDATIVEPNVRLESENGVSLRVFPTSKECAKVLLNYPNGLSVYCHDTHAEQLWNLQENELDERRRICTPYGCTIVFFSNDDMVLIMRYNGEVYRLYNYLEPDKEEEEDLSSEFINACSTNSAYSSYQPLATSTADTTDPVRRAKPRTTRIFGGASDGTEPSKHSLLQRRASKTGAGGKGAGRKARQARNNQAAALFASIDCELNFLKFITALYNINYLSLKLTTSMGSTVHVQKNGKIVCGKPFLNTEWHDYYANESYSMREDGVRMLWKADEMRCYHSDGTVITSTVSVGWDAGVLGDEFDKDITQSSSHEGHKAAKVTSPRDDSIHSQTIYINAPTGTPFSLISRTSVEGENVSRGDSVSSIKAKEKGGGIDDYLVSEFEEESITHDMSFITYTADSYLIQHKLYAGIYFNFTHINPVDLRLETEVFAADDLHIRITQVSPYEVITLDGGMGGQSLLSVIPSDAFLHQPVREPTLSSEADPDEWTQPKMSPVGRTRSAQAPQDRTIVEIDGHNLRMTINQADVLLKTQLRKFGCDENALIVHDELQLSISFEQSLSTTFRSWVETLDRFINCHCPKLKTKYFVEFSGYDCKQKGFELFRKVPPLSNYNFCAGNYLIDIDQLRTINDKMSNKFEWFEKDMQKYPRFPLQRKVSEIVDFPSVLSTKVFVEIPAQLANTDRIHQFADPFTKINFRKLKNRFNEAVLFHLHPRLRSLLHQEISKRSWKNHLRDHKRRLILEQQRLSLYMAMLKHKVYPNYFQFKDQFYYHVRNIDFFEFMASKCSEKANPDRYQEQEPQKEEQPTEMESSARGRKLRKKCLCPKYIKSLQ
ncbi:uncharacterized protein LOC115622631 [Scaptodrosophila lebanonensis]|uniref:Uncharacterized protein LOC115622631 n=1 Tax=Drosophila lebanonensis TaxID=7225 RepID=A0A6J2TC07_DROLE|nr:uncharacterized protein LOC115622631 [Scaptodrosophila lebanonensis]